MDWQEWQDTKKQIYDFIIENRSMYRDDGTDVGLGDIIDFINATVTKSGRKITVDSHGWGGWPLYDAIVDDDWADTGLAEGTVINTYTGTTIWSTVQGAVTGLAAAKGGTIGVCPGTYNEHITIPYDVAGTFYNIEALGGPITHEANTTSSTDYRVKINGSTADTITVTQAANVTLRGLYLTNNNASYHVIAKGGSGSWHTTHVARCYIYHSAATGVAIHLHSTMRLRLDQTEINATGGTAILQGAQATTIRLTDCRITADKIIDGHSAEIEIDRCYLVGALDLVSSYWAIDLIIHDNDIVGAVTVNRCDDMQIVGNRINGGAASCIDVNGVTNELRRAIISDNDLRTTGGHGIYISGYLTGGVVADNTCGGNAAGYTVQAALASEITYSNFSGNTQDGTMAGIYGDQIPGAQIGDDDHKVMVSVNDTTPNYLLAKLAAGTGITLTETNDAGDEDVTITHASIGSGDLHPEYVLESLFDAQSVLAATADNTPAALTLAEQTVVGRLTGGNIAAVSLGIADNNVVQIDQADAADNDYAKFTAAGLEGRSCTEVKQDLDLEDADINTLADAVADGLIAAAFTETSGPTALTLGSITNGQHLQRVNTEIVGSTLSGIYVAKSIVDTKGDLIVAEADNDVGVLAAGANGTVLTADDGEATGLKWAAAGGGVSEISLGTYPGGMSYTP